MIINNRSVYQTKYVLLYTIIVILSISEILASKTKTNTQREYIKYKQKIEQEKSSLSIQSILSGVGMVLYNLCMHSLSIDGLLLFIIPCIISSIAGVKSSILSNGRESPQSESIFYYFNAALISSIIGMFFITLLLPVDIPNHSVITILYGIFGVLSILGILLSHSRNYKYAVVGPNYNITNNIRIFYYTLSAVVIIVGYFAVMFSGMPLLDVMLRSNVLIFSSIFGYIASCFERRYSDAEHNYSQYSKYFSMFITVISGIVGYLLGQYYHEGNGVMEGLFNNACNITSSLNNN
ncbi:hypothetical protein NEPAR06_0255 [Nematocida parisii]|uniref:Uncharacterized protein n=1 Tax=Nematocida parisii (strain ERTm3) TaxID=935791 RepID=I3EJ12_NEMP3|nr:uncharacterized protein NEPG_01583 [Nematocida parisii ERTm1]EIJ89209.1 hypothetical protein NEQG_01028 [Nematocida parisii ERTm3]EIJ93241.1 hypothetical protein NEPG_01583 [Nematocida parisii ERTm1]KAI5142937.1 hypothetical protein NEPAR07_0391 [Nematocida parisii]KAI5153205.1 hypothetical protein NEPAR06_0255 [Nematocida parisii]|eukprot:XP_013059411.1 hypothetical protein NEPG_01583 [Nematocida parisii ERTm1]